MFRSSEPRTSVLPVCLKLFLCRSKFAVSHVFLTASMELQRGSPLPGHIKDLPEAIFYHTGSAQKVPLCKVWLQVTISDDDVRQEGINGARV